MLQAGCRMQDAAPYAVCLQYCVFTTLYVYSAVFPLDVFLNTLARQARDWVVTVFSNQFVLNQHWGNVSFYRLVFTTVFTTCNSTCICLQYVFTCVCIVTVTSLLQQDIVKSSCVFQFPVGTQSLSTSIRSAPEQTQSSSCWPWLTVTVKGNDEGELSLLRKEDPSRKGVIIRGSRNAETIAGKWGSRKWHFSEWARRTLKF